MDDHAVWKDLMRLISKDIPQFKVVVKEKSLLMRLLAVILFFVPNFLTRVTTTIGYTVYMPAMSIGRDFSVLSHEYVHMCDQKRLGYKYKLQYLFPQGLAIFSLMALLGFWFPQALVFLGFLIFLAPFPSKGRKEIELRGFGMSIAIDTILGNREILHREFLVSAYARIVSGWSYYKCVSYGEAANTLRDYALKATGNKPMGSPYREILELVDYHMELPTFPSKPSNRGQ